MRHLLEVMQQDQHDENILERSGWAGCVCMVKAPLGVPGGRVGGWSSVCRKAQHCSRLGGAVVEGQKGRVAGEGPG